MAIFCVCLVQNPAFSFEAFRWHDAESGGVEPPTSCALWAHIYVVMAMPLLDLVVSESALSGGALCCPRRFSLLNAYYNALIASCRVMGSQLGPQAL